MAANLQLQVKFLNKASFIVYKKYTSYILSMFLQKKKHFGSRLKLNNQIFIIEAENKTPVLSTENES